LAAIISNGPGSNLYSESLLQPVVSNKLIATRTTHWREIMIDGQD